MKSRCISATLDTVVEIEFTSGHCLWVEAHVPQASSHIEERHLLHTIFSLPTLMCRTLSDGVSLWNVAQVVICCLSPELDAPANAWMGEFVPVP